MKLNAGAASKLLTEMTTGKEIRLTVKLSRTDPVIEGGDPTNNRSTNFQTGGGAA